MDISLLIQSSIRQLDVIAKASDISILVHVAPEMPMMRGDKRVLIQILNNLLSNAVQFTSHGGRVDVFAEVDRQNCIVLGVSDTGEGMSHDDIAKALKPFEQADSTRPARGEGTGLGLHLCAEFMKLFDGTLEIESETGKGTTVTLRFPPKRTINPY